MTCRVDTHIRSYETVITYCDPCLIQYCEVKICKETFSDADLFTVIAIERLIDDNLVIADMAEQTFKYFQAAGTVCGDIALYRCMTSLTAFSSSNSCPSTAEYTIPASIFSFSVIYESLRKERDSNP